MSRRPASLSRRLGDGASIPFMGSLNPKSRPSRSLSIGLTLMVHISNLVHQDTELEFPCDGNFQVAFLIICYIYSGLVGSISGKAYLSRLEGGDSCTAEISRVLPYLKKAYNDSMHKVLHVGPDSCAVVSKLSKEEDTEAWGLEPYDLEDSDASCKSLICKGVVRVADIKFPLPYRSKSFSVVIISDAVDYLSPRYLNKTLFELARVSSDGFVILFGYPGGRRVKVAEMSKFGRPAKLRSPSWWIRFFVKMRLQESDIASKKFVMETTKKGYQSTCQIFHLRSLNQRKMNRKQKHNLALRLQSMPREKIPQLLQIINKNDMSMQQEGDEIEIDIEAYDTETLWELDRFVTTWKKP